MASNVDSKLHKDREEILGFCSRFENIYLYGAGQVAKKMLQYLYEENIEIAGILITQKKEGQKTFGGLPLEEVGSHVFTESEGIILCVGRKLRKEILTKLEGKVPRDRIYVQLLYSMYDSIRNESGSKNLAGGGSNYFSSCCELEKIGRVCGTDKAGDGHDYLRKYEYILKPYKDKAFTFLELGIYQGASMELWSKYFVNADIVGVDIDENCQSLAGGGKRILIMDASLEENLCKLKDLKPTIIVDDASHIWSHQIKALFTLFDALPSGGIYILEDLGTSFPSYRYQNYDDSVVSAYEICSAIAEAVTGGEGLDIAKIPARIALFKWEIESIAKEIDMIAMIEESWIFIKK